MPANLTPEYKAAAAAFRGARDPEDRLNCLREMLRTIPKHKGTEHLQGDIKRRIRELTEELEGPKKGAARGGPALVIRPEGAAQIVLVGPPNSGKSLLHARLTDSGAQSAPYPYTTQYPEPGMMPYEDIQFQLVDLPPMAAAHPLPWIANTLQSADSCLFVIDLGSAACLEEAEAVHTVLRERRVLLTQYWTAPPGAADTGTDTDEDPFTLRLPTLMLANKIDQIADPAAELGTFLELTGLRYPVMPVSASTGSGLGGIGPWLFSHLGIVRVYTKAPGRPPNKERPFTLHRGQTVEHIALLVHKDLAHSLKYARVWGTSGFDGQHVGRDHALSDGDIVELYT